MQPTRPPRKRPASARFSVLSGTEVLRQLFFITCAAALMDLLPLSGTLNHFRRQPETMTVKKAGLMLVLARQGKKGGLRNSIQPAGMVWERCREFD